MSIYMYLYILYIYIFSYNTFSFIFTRYAYIEFVDKSSVENALRLDDTVLKGRNIKVLPKRQNLPSRPPPSVRGSVRGRFGGRGYPGRGRRGGFAGVIRGRGRGRGRFVNRYY